MTDELQSRVVRLEVITEGHEQEIKELGRNSKELKDTLEAVQHTLDQIKYIALGALIMVIAQSMGLSKAIELFLGK